MKGIQCGFAHKALTAIDEAEEGAYLDLDHRLVALLKGKGLVSAYSTWFYHEMLANAENLRMANARLNTVKREASSYQTAITNLERNLKSTWGYTAKEVQEMKDNLAERKLKHAERLGAAERLEERLERLEAMPEPAEDYRLTIDGEYVMLTDRGRMWLKSLSGRLEGFGNAPLENFEGMLEDFESRIDTYCARAVEALELMVSRGFGRHSPHVLDCAVRLATADDTVPQAYSRMRVINDFLYTGSGLHEGVGTYERLIPAAALAMQSGNIEMLKSELIATYETLANNNYYKNFFLWWLASAVMELGRFDVERNIERYEEIRTALANRGWGSISWEKSKRHTCYLAASLAKGMDSPEELAKQLKVQHQRLVSTGRADSDDLATASLILLDSEASLEERTDRFVEAWQETEAYGWGRYHMFYPAAAALAVMPNSVEENVMWLDTIIKRLKEHGLENKDENRNGLKQGLTYRALAILMAAYRGQFRQDVMPRFIVHSDDPLVHSAN